MICPLHGIPLAACMKFQPWIINPHRNQSLVGAGLFLHVLAVLIIGLGEWLLDSHLVKKRLDVRIQGTTDPVWHKGHHENQVGFIYLTKPLKTTNDLVSVKVGYNQSRIYFCAYHLSLEITTEWPMPIATPTQPLTQVISTVGEQVVIIGPDMAGNLDCVGELGIVIHCPYPLELGQGCIQITRDQPHMGQISYYAESSVCRSSL